MTAPSRTSPASRITALVAAALFGLVAALGLFLWPADGRAPADQNQYHLPVIEVFAAQFPRPDVSNYLSATTPGFHLVLALVRRAAGPGELPLRLAALFLSLPMIGLLAAVVARRRSGMLERLAIVAPLACSMYVLASAIWVLPDNMGWLGVLVVLVIALEARSVATLALAGGGTLLLLAMVRQSHLWAAAPLWVAAWLGMPRPGADDGEPGLAAEPLIAPTRMQRLVVVVLGTVPAFGAVAAFILLWKGLTPPAFHQQHQGGNAATPAFILTLLAIYSVFFAAWSKRGMKRIVEDRRWMGTAVVGGIVALVIGLLPETSYSMEAGRWSGLWNVVGKLPVVAERSPVIALGSMAGGVALVLWSASLGVRDRLILLSAFAGFTAAQLPNFEAWQRYSEPFLLMFLAVVAARTMEPSSSREPSGQALRAARLAGPLALAVLLLVVTVITM